MSWLLDQLLEQPLAIIFVGVVTLAVLFGGPAAEHDVSLVSGRAIATALAGSGHDVSG